MFQFAKKLVKINTEVLSPHTFVMMLYNTVHYVHVTNISVLDYALTLKRMTLKQKTRKASTSWMNCPVSSNVAFALQR
jgi:hypothetical protein